MLEVECLAINIPEHIRVNIGELQLGHAIHVRDLVLPPNVVAKAPADAVIVQVKSPQAEPEPGAALWVEPWNPRSSVVALRSMRTPKKPRSEFGLDELRLVGRSLSLGSRSGVLP